MSVFKKNFLWGTFSSAFQYEGAWNKDGKGPSIWDEFNHKPGKIYNGATADISCDFYHNYKEDIKLMKKLKYNAFGLSISWPRIFPDGKGKINKKGIEFYKSVLKELKEAGISTFVALYWWDLPQSLQEMGGWLNRDTSHAFADYSDLCFKEFGNLTDFWVTICEPQVISFFGYYSGVFPPEIKDTKSTLKVAHNLLLGHGLAVDKFEDHNLTSKIGIKLNRRFYEPYDPKSNLDLNATKLAEELDYYLFNDAIMFGEYPGSFYRILNNINADSFIEKGDMEIISQKTDFLGLNYFIRMYVKHERTPFGFSEHLMRDTTHFMNKDTGSYPWEDYPEGLYHILLDTSKRYKNIPIYLTENGKVVNEKEDNLNDIERINYLESHIERCAKAVKKGVDLRGYFVWSFLDTFEWIFGYGAKFGLVHVNFKNQKRTPRESAYWYSKFIEENTE